MLTKFCNACSQDEETRTHLYREFLEYDVWDKQGKCWKKKKNREVIGQANEADPSKGERYYLRLLLNHVK